MKSLVLERLKTDQMIALRQLMQEDEWELPEDVAAELEDLANQLLNSADEIAQKMIGRGTRIGA